MKELAIRMAVNAADLGNRAYSISGIDTCAGLYRINIQTDKCTYACYVDVHNGNVPGIEATPCNICEEAA